MEKLGLNEIRERYLSFFESKGHLRLPSFSLVPQNDPSILLINAGMTPLKPYFTGAEVPPRKRVTTCQKCIRTPDIDNVGKTARHGTFFEMLGNFSFGDYFKNEAIPWAWEFLTGDMQIPADRLYVTIYQDDDEAFEIWNKKVGVPADRIYRFGKEDNFWEHGEGPCGPCSEIHFDRGPEFGCGKPDCRVGCSCDRYMEVWNLVFTQFDRKADGSYERLAFPNIDTGMGLERLACVMQNVGNLFEVDTVRRILDTVCSIAGKTYGANYRDDVSIRVITDHIRSTVMMVSDGVVPSNETRGYVLRRLLRGACRHGKLLGIEGPFLTGLAEVVIEDSRSAYPQLEEKADYIRKVIAAEEERFSQTIDQGMVMLDDIIAAARRENASEVSGNVAFKLHDTYGFPFDLTREVLADNGLTVNEEEFRRAMHLQREKARDAIKNRESSWSGKEAMLPKGTQATVFTGYDETSTTARVLLILKKDAEGALVPAENAAEGEEAVLIFDRTPFYAESGGQESDSGEIITESGGACELLSVSKTNDKVWLHTVAVTDGEIRKGEFAKLSVDVPKRKSTEKNHSATHLLQKALIEVLGDHVHQAGSSVNADRLRFDFNHMQAMTQQEIALAEDKVNDAISAEYQVAVKEMPIDEAKQSGATALFGEKYGDVVRVVNMGGYSIELCGGTHVKNTSAIGLFKIIHESAVSAGIRRIEAITGKAALSYFKAKDSALSAACELMKATPDDIGDKIRAQNEKVKELSKEIDRLKKEKASGSFDDVIKNASEVNGVTVFTGRFDELTGDALREACEKLRDKAACSLAVVASAAGGKVSIVAMASKECVEKGVRCGDVIKKAAGMCGGGGGGRPDMAQAGGKDVEAVDAMLEAVKTFIA
ncbi:MAG: alanine--tRNA ligase [Clostridia bacterium]|nr:alanine--tRNA ligase [Clostridia bacterium]